MSGYNLILLLLRRVHEEQYMFAREGERRVGKSNSAVSPTLTLVYDTLGLVGH